MLCMNRSPIPRELCFCATAVAQPVWTIKIVIVPQQMAQSRQSGGRSTAMVAQGLSWWPNGGTVVATGIAQWTSLVAQRRQNVVKKGGRRITQIHTQCLQQYVFYGASIGWPLHIQSATTAIRVPPLASFERPVSDRPQRPQRPLCDCFEHAQFHGDHGVYGEVWTSSVSHLNDQGSL